MPDELPSDDLDDLPVIPRAPARSDSRVSRAVRRISAGIPALLAPLTAPSRRSGLAHAHGPERTRELALDNGFGGLTAEGDYEIRVHGDQVPPAPWSNVIANRTAASW